MFTLGENSVWCDNGCVIGTGRDEERKKKKTKKKGRMRRWRKRRRRKRRMYILAGRPLGGQE